MNFSISGLIILGYKEANYFDKDGKEIKQYKLCIAYPKDGYSGLYCRLAFINSDSLLDLSFSDLMSTSITCTCYYVKKIDRFVIRRIDNID